MAEDSLTRKSPRQRGSSIRPGMIGTREHALGQHWVNRSRQIFPVTTEMKIIRFHCWIGGAVVVNVVQLASRDVLFAVQYLVEVIVPPSAVRGKLYHDSPK